MKIEMVDSIYFCGVCDKEDIQKHKAIIESKTKDWLNKL